jgi:uncharacterized membrane protein
MLYYHQHTKEPDMFLVDGILHHIRDAIGALGVVVICVGALRSLYQLSMLLFHRTYNENYIRLEFGNSVILGLEFMVGADIIGSLVAPDYYNLGLLAIIVIVRTVLSYFLSKELQALTPDQRKTMQK